MDWVVLSVGGSLVVPDEIDYKFLRNLKKMLRPLLRVYKFALVIGGGKTARRYIVAAQKANPHVSRREKDLVGIKATHLNEQLVYSVFEKEADKHLLTKRPSKISTKKPMILAAGWDAGASTDYNAVQMARILGTKLVINLTNVDYVFTKNPKKFRDARPLKSLSWDQFKKIIGGAWSPGLNVPFDPIASRYASREGLKVIVINGAALANVKRCIQGKPFKGTIIQG